MRESFDASETQHQVISCERIGNVHVYIDGDLASAHGDHVETASVFLTVHDIGFNHHQWLSFTHHSSMRHIRSKTLIIHVDLPGQEDNAPDCEGDKFPSLQEIAEDLKLILDSLQIKFVIGLGIGVGSNILTRFAIAHKDRCHGIFCINPNVSSSGVMENIKDKFLQWTGGSSEYSSVLEPSESKEDMLESFRGSHLNKGNISKLFNSYLKRDNIGAHLEKGLTCEALLICGSKCSDFVGNVESMYSFSNKCKTSILKLDDVGNVLEEAPSKLAQSLLLFCKGIGWLTSLTLPGLERQRSTASVSSDGDGGLQRRRSMSMEEYDTPNIRRLSLTPSNN